MLLGVNYVPKKGVGYLPLISEDEFLIDIKKIKNLKLNAIRLPCVKALSEDGKCDYKVLDHYAKLALLAKANDLFVELVALPVGISGRNFFKGDKFFTGEDVLKEEKKVVDFIDNLDCVDQIDLSNEPDIYYYLKLVDPKRKAQHVNREQAKKWANYLLKNTKKPTTIGLTHSCIFPHSFIEEDLETKVNSVHYYWFFRKEYKTRWLQERPELDAIECMFLLSTLTGKPLYLQETGITDISMKKQKPRPPYLNVKEMQHFLYSMIPFCANKNFMGISFWTLNDIVSEDFNYKNNPIENYFGLYDQRDEVKPVGKLIENFSFDLWGLNLEKTIERKAEVAIVIPEDINVDYKSIKSELVDKFFKCAPYVQSYYLLKKAGVSKIDVVRPTADLKDYKIVIKCDKNFPLISYTKGGKRHNIYSSSAKLSYYPILHKFFEPLAEKLFSKIVNSCVKEPFKIKDNNIVYDYIEKEDAIILVLTNTVDKPIQTTISGTENYRRVLDLNNKSYDPKDMNIWIGGKEAKVFMLKK